jgi:uncharacterized membrane protein
VSPSGADLLYLREIKHSAVGMTSIGGAGTFDRIVLSGIVAAYLA